MNLDHTAQTYYFRYRLNIGYSTFQLRCSTISSETTQAQIVRGGMGSRAGGKQQSPFNLRLFNLIFKFNLFYYQLHNLHKGMCVVGLPSMETISMPGA